jgi:hypothetical protein
MAHGFLLVTSTGWYRAKPPMHCAHFLIYCVSPSEFYSFLIHPPELSGKSRQTHLVAKQREIWREWSVNSADEVCLSCFAGLTCCKILRHGAGGFTSPPKEGVPRIIISPLKMYRPRPGLNQRTLGPIASTTSPPRTSVTWLSSIAVSVVVVAVIMAVTRLHSRYVTTEHGWVGALSNTCWMWRNSLFY